VAPSKNLYPVSFDQTPESDSKQTISLKVNTGSYTLGVIASTFTLDLFYFFIVGIGGRDLGWYGLYRKRFYLASGNIVKGIWKGIPGLLRRIATWVENMRSEAQEPIALLASNEPLLDGVDLEDKASLPPPYVSHVGGQSLPLRSSLHLLARHGCYSRGT
jgi:hypothetical protein